MTFLRSSGERLLQLAAFALIWTVASLLYGWSLGRNVDYLMIFGGATRDGLSIIPWSYSMITWLGMALCLVLPWHDFLDSRVYYLVIRSGSFIRPIVSRLARDCLIAVAWASLSFALWLPFMAPSSRSVVEIGGHHVAGGTTSVVLTELFLLCGRYLSGQDWVVIALIPVVAISSLPVFPGWPFAWWYSLGGAWWFGGPSISQVVLPFALYAVALLSMFFVAKLRRKGSAL